MYTYTIYIYSQIFHGSDPGGSVRVNETNTLYQFRMSAVAVIGGEQVEGYLSEVTAQSIVLVPTPGI